MIVVFVRDFTICSNINGLGLRSNAIKDLCPLILHQLAVGWIGKAHGPTSDTKATVIGSSRWSRIVREGIVRDFTICSNTNGLGLRFKQRQILYLSLAKFFFFFLRNLQYIYIYIFKQNISIIKISLFPHGLYL